MTQTEKKPFPLITIILVCAAVSWGVRTIEDFSWLKLTAFLAFSVMAVLSSPSKKQKAEGR